MLDDCTASQCEVIRATVSDYSPCRGVPHQVRRHPKLPRPMARRLTEVPAVPEHPDPEGAARLATIRSDSGGSC